MKKCNALLGLLAAFLTLGVGNVATAGNNYPTSLSMNYSSASGGRFAGKVRSRNVCVSKRRVLVYRKSPGRDPSIGGTTSSGSGRWDLRTGKPRTGDYYARTAPKPAGSGVRCGGARSATTHVS